jgi:hypothetical protein
MILQLLLSSVFLFIVYVGYHYFYLPWKLHTYFKQFPNAFTSPKYVHIKGDINWLMTNPISIFWSIVEKKMENPSYDIMLLMVGFNSLLCVTDPTLCMEMDRMIPDKIDRRRIKDSGFLKLNP